MAAVGGVAFLAFHDDAVPLISSGPSPRTPVEAFTAAWVAGDYHTMYRQLAPQSRAATTYRAFRRAYGQAATVSTLKSLKVTGPGVMAAGVDTVPMALRTSEFGLLQGELQVPVVRAGSRYLISWAPELVWPGLQPGEQLVSTAKAPDHRGAILATNRMTLARGPADDRQYPQGAPFYTLTGFVRSPQTAAAACAARCAGLAGKLHVRPGRPRAVAEPGAGRRPGDHPAGSERLRQAADRPPSRAPAARRGDHA